MPSVPRLILPASLTLLAACSSTPPSSVSLKDDRSCPLNLHAGQTLIVSLPSNPTSGYRWNLQDAAPGQLKSLGPEVFSSPDKDVIGGEGLSTWRFQVQGGGSGRLYLAYQQPWDAAAEPAGLFDCRIEVR
ncbi:peptidase inhibitor I42 [Stutzerimonas nosocomialis]|uniref:protease inhibitor I42 family protein n=1 Tax=Stutzerimonas nosocomialis TaxID=1056496 RepID=UPI00110819C6|nr:protease inhibitor I42 family protein [Stutzerimonas nosocomialis]TLX54703.1 peptidase inhibitor I42 [Stutzerimonas nosocomialis]TLX58306.1 peptidase inhibitor I42 [Stutzerimonas nosocomialis]